MLIGFVQTNGTINLQFFQPATKKGISISKPRASISR